MFQNNLNKFFNDYNKKSLLKISWKLNNIQDNNLYDQNYLFELYKVVILEDYCAKYKIKKIILNGSDVKIKKIIKIFCREKKINFEYKYLKQKYKKKFKYKNFFLNIIPNFLITLMRLNIFLILRIRVLLQKKKNNK